MQVIAGASIATFSFWKAAVKSPSQLIFAVLTDLFPVLPSDEKHNMTSAVALSSFAEPTWNVTGTLGEFQHPEREERSFFAAASAGIAKL